jgi:hypothetical protein
MCENETIRSVETILRVADKGKQWRGESDYDIL